MADKPQIPVAVALDYRRESDPAPRVVATGKGVIAEAMLEIARRHGVAVHEDAALAEVLSILKVDSLIPLAAYAAVAEILAYIYRVGSEKKA